MDARRRRSSCPGAAVPLLLVLAASFGGHAAAAAAPAPVGAPSGDAGMTALQKHTAFFDSNHDGIVTFDETYEGLKEVGVGTVTAKASAAFINAALGPKTRPDNSNSSRMDIYIVNIHKGIHGSDTGAYDAQGRFVPEKLDEMFAKHGKNVSNALTKDELDEMLKANREDKDFKGWLGASAEWKMLYNIAKDKDGYLPKGTVRAVYDGTLFYQLAALRKKG
ncbi:probable peroxygenase 5 isoform X2 [Phragmites australis]|uniref:probable peroxygenase 5 isoform X2 n=1 Tax=Phragmites australis TaxID=29695 RepID=UPI002D7677F0|nr:probable peroxygenase 5 isoform X2 [Phragmites australis]